MRYFYIILALIMTLVVGIFGFRGQTFKEAPRRIFPDMDDQDRVDGQDYSSFFADGFGSRQPVANTQPRGFHPHAPAGSTPEFGFGDGEGYYDTGKVDAFWGEGMPEELELTEENVGAFLLRGEERYAINCAVCHGDSGNGKGIVASYEFPAIANLRTFEITDGRLYDVIKNGKGLMGGYGHNVSVRDRWAIVAYVRALQLSDKASKNDPKYKAALEELTQK